MKDKREEQGDSYWKYLEENSKVVATWPDWLKGDRSGCVIQEPERNDEEEKLAS